MFLKLSVPDNDDQRSTPCHVDCVISRSDVTMISGLFIDSNSVIRRLISYKRHQPKWKECTKHLLIKPANQQNPENEDLQILLLTNPPTKKSVNQSPKKNLLSAYHVLSLFLSSLSCTLRFRFVIFTIDST